MKKAIMILLNCILLFLSARGQITKGNWMVGGDASFSLDHTHYENDELPTGHGYNALISPQVGYFLMDKLAAGLDADFNFRPFQNATAPKKTQYSLSAGPFARYYFLPAENVINIFSGVAYEHHFRLPYDIPANTYSFFTGTSFFFNSSVAAELLAGFDYAESPGGGTTRNFKLNIGFQIYLKK